MREIKADRVSVDGNEIFFRRVSGEGVPTVFVHGNPTHSADWLPFMRAIPGPAIAPDLVGFGRSAKPRRFDYSMHGLAKAFEQTLDAIGVGEHNLVVHDWGALALIAAQRSPQAVKRLVIVNAVPLLPGYRWHWVARIWRRRVVGELMTATTTRAGAALLLRQARPGFRPMPTAFVEMVWDGWDRGTRRAILSLYRSADPDELEAAGKELPRLRCPALVIWGREDPYLPERFGRQYAQALPNALLSIRDRAGHWPWIDRPEVISEVIGFLANGASGTGPG